MKSVDMPSSWPGGSGSWEQPGIVIITHDVRARSERWSRERLCVVVTLLDLITRLEEAVDRVTTVVLDGIYWGNHELRAALVELYPAARVIDGDPQTSPVVVEREGFGPALPAT